MRKTDDGLIEQVIVRRSRLLDKELAAQYLGTSTDTIDRLIWAGQLPVVKLPVERTASGRGATGTSRRVLIDVRDLEQLIEQSKERAEQQAEPVTVPTRRRA